MSVSPQPVTGGREGLKAFRLCDLPANVRDYGVFEFERVELEGNGAEFSALTLAHVAAVKRAADRPSDRVYYIPHKAWVKVMRKFKLDKSVLVA